MRAQHHYVTLKLGWIQSQRYHADSIRKLIYHPKQMAAHNRTPSSQLLMSTCPTRPTKPVVEASDKHDLAASASSWRWIQSQRSLADSIRKLISHPKQMAAPSTTARGTGTCTAKVALRWRGTESVQVLWNTPQRPHTPGKSPEQEERDRCHESTDLTSAFLSYA